MIPLKQQRDTLIEHLNLKLTQRDWRGVADAAMDIREIEARMEERELVDNHPPIIVREDGAIKRFHIPPISCRLSTLEQQTIAEQAK